MVSVKEGRFSIGVGAIIEYSESGEILLLHRAPTMDFASDQWDDVGGRMHQFEEPDETLRREVREETGINQLVIVKPIDVSHYFRGSKIADNEIIVIMYWCKTYSLIIVDHSMGKIRHLTNVFGYKLVRNTWDLNKISKLKTEYVKDASVEIPSYYEYYLEFSDGNRITVYRINQEFPNIIETFNLYIKGKYATPGIIH